MQMRVHELRSWHNSCIVIAASLFLPIIPGIIYPSGAALSIAVTQLLIDGNFPCNLPSNPSFLFGVSS